MVIVTYHAQMWGGSIFNIGSCKTWFNSTSDLVQINEIQTKGLELVNKKLKKEKAMPMYIRRMLNGGKFIFHSIVIIIGKNTIFLIKSNKD
jgi:hypothetical protein